MYPAQYQNFSYLFAFSWFLCITVHGVVIKGETGNLICPNETVGQLSWIEELFYLVIESDKYRFSSKRTQGMKIRIFFTLVFCFLSRLKSKAKVTCCQRNLVYFSGMWYANQYILKPQQLNLSTSCNGLFFFLFPSPSFLLYFTTNMILKWIGSAAYKMGYLHKRSIQVDSEGQCYSQCGF